MTLPERIAAIGERVDRHNRDTRTRIDRLWTSIAERLDVLARGLADVTKRLDALEQEGSRAKGISLRYTADHRLQPCGECGERPEVECDGVRAAVRCLQCGISASASKAVDAEDMWNRLWPLDAASGDPRVDRLPECPVCRVTPVHERGDHCYVTCPSCHRLAYGATPADAAEAWRQGGKGAAQ